MADAALTAEPLGSDPAVIPHAKPQAGAAGKHYTVLARRYRPQTFEEVIGQGHVARALKNAIATGRVAHAYLFTGARGVGKTSTARIFAKALNCPNSPREGEGAGVPCNACEICEAVSAGDDVDVLEIDGASNNGVDHVRDLRSNVTVKPMRARFKVYIIDEVHMLSKAAFNALLKTLEEPPGGVKFVFCTTEPNKLPDTILSRVQRFDFATVGVQNIIRRLASIAEAEGFEVDQPALELVARRAAGSMRDSQSLFDQLLSFGGDRITADEVHRLFGTAGDDRLLSLLGRCVDGDPAGALGELEEAIGDGVQLDELASQVVALLRDVMVLAAGADSVPLLAVGEDSREPLRERARAWGVQTTLAAVQILSEAKLKMGRVTFGRALFEAALVRAATLGDLDDLAGLAESLRAGGDGSTGSPAPPRNGRPTPARRLPTNGRDRSNRPPARGEAKPTTPARAETPRPADPPPAEKQPAVVPLPAGPPAAPTVPLAEGREGDLLAALKHAAGERSLPTGVRDISRLAISGPNRVRLHFPAALKLAADRCENGRQALDEVLRDLTGAAVSFETKLDAAPEKQAVDLSKTDREDLSRPQPVDPDDIADPFVREAARIFDARQITTQTLPPTTPG